MLKTVDVDIERPRDYRVLTSQRFLKLEHEVRVCHPRSRRARPSKPANGSLHDGRSQLPSARPQTFGARARRWLRGLLNLNFFLGVLSIGTLGSVWEFARPLGHSVLIGNLPPHSEVVRRLRKTSRLKPLLGRLGAQRPAGLPRVFCSRKSSGSARTDDGDASGLFRHHFSDSRDPSSDPAGRLDSDFDHLLADA